MEPVDGNRQSSGISSIINREKPERINTERPYTSSVNTMAAAAVAGPLYPSNPPPPYSSWSGPAHSLSGLISPTEARRISDNEKSDRPAPTQTSQTHRQSLPSIHEALGTTPKSNPYASPVSAPLPPAAHQLPYTQPQQAPPLPRTYPPSDHSSYPTHAGPSQQRQPSPPQPIHPQSNPFSRPEAGPGNFPEAPRHPSISSLQPAPAPHNPYAAPVYEPARYDHDPRAREGVPNGYSHPPPPPPPPQQQPPYTYGPAQPPLTPSHPMPMYSQPRYGPRDPREGNDAWKYSKEVEKSDPAASTRAGLKRNLDVWDFENNLAEINISSSALQEWSAHYNAIAQEQQRSQNTLPDRMPTMESVDDMMRHQSKICTALQRMQSIIMEQASIDQRMREQGNRLAGEYEDEMSLYGDDMKNHGYTSEGKKRRGRAAPPGRCHSCNRAETPEWRRGPDGARTLCNACGLHYAKLTRKNTMKQSQGSNGSSLRPKSMDGVSPR